MCVFVCVESHRFMKTYPRSRYSNTAGETDMNTVVSHDLYTSKLHWLHPHTHTHTHTHKSRVGPCSLTENDLVFKWVVKDLLQPDHIGVI